MEYRSVPESPVPKTSVSRKLVRATPNPDGDICLQPGRNQLADLVSGTLDGGKGLALAAWILVPPAGSHAVLSAQNRNRTTPVRR